MAKPGRCVYRINPGLYGRVFSMAGVAWSSSCGGKYGPYYVTSRPQDGDQCINCECAIKVEGLSNGETDDL